MQGIPAFPVSLSLQMVYILPERLLALVRPAFDLVLRRIRSLKRCVQACGCKTMTPNTRRNLAPGCHFKRCQALPKETPFPFFFRGPLFLGPLVFFFLFFLSPAKVGSLEMQPGAKLQAYLGVIILQPHACTQRFRLRILRRTSSWGRRPYAAPRQPPAGRSPTGPAGQSPRRRAPSPTPTRSRGRAGSAGTRR